MDSGLIDEQAAHPIRVLYAASSPADGEFVRTETSAHSPLISITCATGAEEALTCLDAIGPFDAVLVDPDLPDSSPAALISRIRVGRPAVGIVACVTGDDEALATPALEAGAHAWIPKRRDTLAQLYPVFRRAIDRSRPSPAAMGQPVELAADDGTMTAPAAGFDAAMAMRQATLAHEAERARLEQLMAAQDAEATRLTAEIAALQAAHESAAQLHESARREHQAVRQELESQLRAAQEALRIEREATNTVLGDREAARVGLANELAVSQQQHQVVVAELNTTLEARDRHIATLAAELEAARASEAGALEAPQTHERDRLDARAEAGRLIAGVADDMDALLTALGREHQRLREALTHANANTAMADGFERPLREGHALTRMLGAFSRREIQRAQTSDLHALMDGLRPMIARLADEDVQIDLECPPHSAAVPIDPRRLEFVLMNVIMIVRSQLQTGGRVRIIANGAELEVTARLWRHDIAIPELATDRWLAATRHEPMDLTHLQRELQADGGWLDTSRTTADQIVIRIGLAGA